MKSTIGIFLAVLLFILGSSVYTVQQWETAILFRLGEIVKANVKPGLHFKTPFVNNVKTFDIRLQSLDAAPERYLTREKKNLIVDSFVKWRVVDAKKFYTTMGGDYRMANLRLSQIVKDDLRAAFGERTVQELVSGDRDQLVKKINHDANEQAKSFGIEIADIRIKRIDLPADVSDSVFRRMEAERNRVAKDLRSQGAEAAEKIRADADRQRVVILAEAYRKAEKIRGQGDAQASKIYAQAYSKDKPFFAFYQSLNAYQQAFKDKSDMIVVDPKSEYFKYFEKAGK
ncbi:protease modulator HflC [Galenea microaerophila]